MATTTYESDTGVRANVLANSWGTASDGNAWVLSGGSNSALSATTSLLEITGASNVIMTIGAQSQQSVVVSVQATVGNVNDSPALILRYTNGSNYIKCDVSGGLLRIRKNISPSGLSNVATTAFSLTANTTYLFVFQVSGTTYSAKAYPVGNADPGWLVSGTATDSALSNGFWGLSATSASLPVQYSQFQVSGLLTINPYNLIDNPYGFTTYNSSSTRLDLSQLITDIKTLGLTWRRCNIRVASIDSPQGTYTWTSLDAAVAAANAAGINIIYSPLQPPTWALDGTTGLPTPAYTTTFFNLLGARYNGTAGFGHLDAIEIWNEEFDNGNSYTNTTYGPVAQAGYNALRGAGFTGKIGCAAMLGISSTTHITNWLNALYTQVVASLFDYYSLHYYPENFDPSQFTPAGSGYTSFLSFTQVISTIQSALVTNNDVLKPLWVTEFGYATNTNGGFNPNFLTTPQQQNQYYSYILNTARSNSQQLKAGPIQKIMFFSMDTDAANTDGESITQGLAPSETYLPAFYTVKGFIDAYYYWPGIVADFPSTSRRLGTLPSTRRRGA